MVDGEDMGAGDVGNVDVVADTRAVACIIVVAMDHKSRQFADGR